MSFVDPDIKASGLHGPKPAEVYGFVGSITTVVATGLSMAFWVHLLSVFGRQLSVWVFDMGFCV